MLSAHREVHWQMDRDVNRHWNSDALRRRRRVVVVVRVLVVVQEVVEVVGQLGPDHGRRLRLNTARHYKVIG